MTTFAEEVNTLTAWGALPTRQYIAVQRFVREYKNPSELWGGISAVALGPIYQGVAAAVEAMRAVWATLRAIGNLLVLKPGDAWTAAKDAGIRFTLSLCIAAMAPIDLLSSSLELLTRVITSWFSGNDLVNDLQEQSGLIEQLKESATSYGEMNLLPSSAYFSKSRFFSAYADGTDCLVQAASPFISASLSSVFIILESLGAVNSAIDCIGNLIIGRPRHALANIKNFTAQSAMAISLAVMTPINMLVESLIFFSKLPATWLDACTKSKEDDADFTPEFEVSNDTDVNADDVYAYESAQGMTSFS